MRNQPITPEIFGKLAQWTAELIREEEVKAEEEKRDYLPLSDSLTKSIFESHPELLPFNYDDLFDVVDGMVEQWLRLSNQ